MESVDGDLGSPSRPDYGALELTTAAAVPLTLNGNDCCWKRLACCQRSNNLSSASPVFLGVQPGVKGKQFVLSGKSSVLSVLQLSSVCK